MKKLNNIAAAGLLTASLTGCFGPSQQEIDTCYQPYKQKIENILEKESEYSPELENQIRSARVFVISKRDDLIFQYAGINEHIRDNYSQNEVDILMGKLNELSQVRDLISQGYGACYKGVDDEEKMQLFRNSQDDLRKKVKSSMGELFLLKSYLKSRNVEFDRNKKDIKSEIYSYSATFPEYHQKIMNY